MTAPRLSETPDIEAVLADHEFDLSDVLIQRDESGQITGYMLTCTCGFEFPPDPEVNHHRAHVAQALAPVLAAAVREARAAELREAARALPGFDGIRTHGDAARWLRDRADRIAVDATRTDQADEATKEDR